MRDTSPDGKCPVFDKGVVIFPENQLVVNVFKEAQGSGVQIDAKDKNYIYIKPTEVESLLRIRQIDPDEWGDVMNGVFVLQNISNNLRPKKKKPKKVSRRRR